MWHTEIEVNSQKGKRSHACLVGWNTVFTIVLTFLQKALFLAWIKITRTQNHTNQNCPPGWLSYPVPDSDTRRFSETSCYSSSPLDNYHLRVCTSLPLNYERSCCQKLTVHAYGTLPPVCKLYSNCWLHCWIWISFRPILRRRALHEIAPRDYVWKHFTWMWRHTDTDSLNGVLGAFVICGRTS